jgi:hypothetical protein
MKEVLNSKGILILLMWKLRLSVFQLEMTYSNFNQLAAEPSALLRTGDLVYDSWQITKTL